LSQIRDVLGCIKYYDFAAVPLIQIYTSAPMKRYLNAARKKD
jgi:hypothetical protein